MSSASSPYRLFVSAGEASGDLHTANLLRALQQQTSVTVEGFGGERMAQTGVDVLFDLPQMALIGFVEVAKHLPTVYHLFQIARKRWSQARPDAILLTDFPGMHLRLAKVAAEYHIPVIYYISPQLWAWHESRVEQIRRYVKRLIVILPFEVEFYKRHKIDVYYAGHPLLDVIPQPASPTTIPERTCIGLLPGSRGGELRHMLPVMLEAARRLHGAHPDWRFVLPLASTLPTSILDRYNLPEWIEVIRDESYAARQAMTVAWTASGTATVENALLGVPMAILYRSHPINIFLGRRLIRVPYIGMANLIAGNGVCPEFIQEQCRPSVLSIWTEEFILNPDLQCRVREGLGAVRQRLGDPGASQRAAAEVGRILQEWTGKR